MPPPANEDPALRINPSSNALATALKETAPSINGLASSPSRYDSFRDSFSPGSSSSRSSHPPMAGAAAMTSPTTTSAPSSSIQPPPPPPAEIRGLNPRSCVTCRRRKVKCDKRNPCSNCLKAHIQCIFPEPARQQRKLRKPHDHELLKRLAKLEGVVDQLSGSVVEDGKPVNALNGRLLTDGEGKSRYVSSNYWASLSSEFEDIRSALFEDSEDDELEQKEDWHKRTSLQGLVFGLETVAFTLQSLHPPPAQIMQLLDIYTENVHPVLAIFHLPQVKKAVIDHATDLSDIPRDLEALMFAIYYGSITSMQAQECLDILGEEKTSIRERIRYGLEQALARAELTRTSDMRTLQALLIFLVCLRRSDETRSVWALTGLAVRLAQSLGLHRDGTAFNLPPFEIEMRRRLWWHICVLDVRAAEDHGLDTYITDEMADTKFPLNVNNDDLDPEMKEMPEEHQGCTDFTFNLIRMEVSAIFRKLNFNPPRPHTTMTMQEKMNLVESTRVRLEERYMRDIDTEIPLNWVCATVTRIIFAKMWLIMHHPYQHLDHGGSSLSQETKNRLFANSIEVVEFSHRLETGPRTKKWCWIFKTYVHWHSIAFMLSELCTRPSSAETERAWRAIEYFVLTRGSELDERDERSIFPMRALQKLWERANNQRVKQGGKHGIMPPALLRRIPRHTSQSSPDIDVDMERGKEKSVPQQGPGKTSTPVSIMGYDVSQPVKPESIPSKTVEQLPPLPQQQMPPTSNPMQPQASYGNGLQMQQPLPQWNPQAFTQSTLQQSPIAQDSDNINPGDMAWFNATWNLLPSGAAFSEVNQNPSAVGSGVTGGVESKASWPQSLPLESSQQPDSQEMQGVEVGDLFNTFSDGFAQDLIHGPGRPGRAPDNGMWW